MLKKWFYIILGAHQDYGILTLLATDSTPGLQVKTGGKWMDVTPVRGAFIVNIGDLLEVSVLCANCVLVNCFRDGVVTSLSLRPIEF